MTGWPLLQRATAQCPIRSSPSSLCAEENEQNLANQQIRNRVLFYHPYQFTDFDLESLNDREELDSNSEEESDLDRLAGEDLMDRRRINSKCGTPSCRRARRCRTTRCHYRWGLRRGYRRGLRKGLRKGRAAKCSSG